MGVRDYPWLFLETVLAHGWWCGFSVQPPGCVWDAGHSDIDTLGITAVASSRGIVVVYRQVFHKVPQFLPPEVAIWVLNLSPLVGSRLMWAQVVTLRFDSIPLFSSLLP